MINRKFTASIVALVLTAAAVTAVDHLGDAGAQDAPPATICVTDENGAVSCLTGETEPFTCDRDQHAGTGVGAACPAVPVPATPIYTG